MNYYSHHLGDYSSATAHLSWDEDMAYSRLLRAYYQQEKPLPVEIKDVCRLVRASSRAQKTAVETVLKEFFVLEDDGWHQKRCDEEIASFKDKQTKAKRSADVRWSAKQSHSERNANALPTQSEGNAPNPNPNPNPNIRTKKEPPLTPQGALAAAREVEGLDVEAFDRWVKYRAERKPAIKPASMKAAAEKLAAFGERQSTVVLNSIAEGYQGLIEPRVNGSTGAGYKTKFERMKEALHNA